MDRFETKRLPVQPDAVASDGSEFRRLLRLKGGSLAHFALASGATSIAVAHRTVEELWFFLCGRGEMWRLLGAQECVVPVERGVCVTLPVGTHFQFRSFGGTALAAIGVGIPIHQWYYAHRCQ